MKHNPLTTLHRTIASALLFSQFLTSGAEIAMITPKDPNRNKRCACACCAENRGVKKGHKEGSRKRCQRATRKESQVVANRRKHSMRTKRKRRARQ